MIDETQVDNFNLLRERVKIMIDLYEKEKNKNNMLVRENHSLTERIKVTQQKLDDLNTKYNKLKIAKTLIASSNDVHDAKLKVNRMVREIDRCIALLNR